MTDRVPARAGALESAARPTPAPPVLDPLPGRLGWAELEQIRSQRGRSTLLFITDRCPVECDHCSVDSRRDSPSISDFDLFGRIVDGLCAQPGLDVIGVSGGEPFVERRGLSLVARRVTESGRRLVVYTSGHWGVAARPPAWIAEVLARTTTVFLSTDGFHAERLPDERYIHAARAVAASGAWIVVQCIDLGSMVERAADLLTRALGSNWTDHAELHPTPPLTAGRGGDHFTLTRRAAGADFGACSMVASPMVRYDGTVTGCCNEGVIMGHGPDHLRRRLTVDTSVGDALDGFHADPWLRAMGGAGLGALTDHPRFADLADRRFTSICDLCWQMLDRVDPDEAEDPLVTAINLIGAP